MSTANTEHWNPMVPELTVTDFAKSFEFYTMALGFSIKFTRENPKFAYLYLGSAQLMIEELNPMNWKTGELTYPLGRGVNFQIEIFDVEAIYSQVKKQSLKLFRDLQESCYQTDEGKSVQKEFLLQDPDGYLLRFCEHIVERP